MNDSEIKIAEEEAATAAAKQEEEAEAARKAEEAEATPTPDPVKDELEKVKKKEAPKYTEAQKAAFSLKKNADRLKELGGDPASVLGITYPDTQEENDDDKPVTVGMLKQLEREKVKETATQLADAIEDPDERELTKHYLTRIVPSDNPSEDLKLARGAVNSLKHSQILEEIGRKTPPRNNHSGAGAPPKTEDTFVPTADEASMMKVFGLTEKEVIESRQKTAEANK